MGIFKQQQDRLSARMPRADVINDGVELLGLALVDQVLVVLRAVGVELLDFREAPRDPYQPSRDDPAIPGTSNLWELPVAENPFAPGGPIGLGYLNAYGVEKTIQAIALSSSDPCVFLIHPWELVDPPPGPIPEWMRAACTSDPSKLDALLERLGQEHDLTTIDAELAMVR